MNNQNSGVAEGGNALKQLYCTPYAACCITHTYVSSRGGNGGAKWQRADSSAALCLLKCNFCYLYLSLLQLIKSTTAVSYINTYRVLYQRTHTTHSPTGKMWVRRAHSFRLCFRRRLLLVSSKQKLNVTWKILRYARKASVTVAKVAAAAARVLRAQRVAQQLACYSIKISALLWRHMQFKQEIQSDCSGQPTLKRVSQQTGGTGWTALATYRQEVPIFVDYAASTAAQWICLLSFVHRALHPHTHLLIHSFIGCSVCSFAHPFAPKYLSCAFRNWLLDTSEVTATAYPRSHCQVFAENLRLLCRVYFTLDLRTTRTCLFSLANSGPAITLTFMMYAHVCAHRTAARATR